MILEIELGGRWRAVDVRRDGANWVVTVDGRAVSATVAEVGGRWSLLLAPGPAEGQKKAKGPAEAGLYEDAVGPAEVGLQAGAAGRPADERHVASGFPPSPEASARLAGARFARRGGSRTFSYEVSFETRNDGGSVVHVNGATVAFTVADPRRRVGRRGDEPGAHAGSQPGVKGPSAIVAPMPGRIVKVLVKPGDAVAAGQGVVVVEAMKMENELRAPRAGTVADVRVSEGMSVEANAVLAVVK